MKLRARPSHRAHKPGLNNTRTYTCTGCHPGRRDSSPPSTCRRIQPQTPRALPHPRTLHGSEHPLLKKLLRISESRCPFLYQNAFNQSAVCLPISFRKRQCTPALYSSLSVLNASRVCNGMRTLSKGFSRSTVTWRSRSCHEVGYK